MEDKFTAIVAADDLCPCLRGFDEGEALASVNGALALRPKIEGIVDQIWADGFDGIWFMGIGGTWASCLQAEVHMRGKSRLPVFAENAAEFLTTGNRRFTEKSVVVLSSVSGNTKEATISPETETINITATSIYCAALTADIVKAHTGDNTDSTTYSGWNSTVYVPAGLPAASTT